MPQGSHMKGKAKSKKGKVAKVAKKGGKVTKRTPKKTVAGKKKLQKALETSMKANIENELRSKAGGSSTTTDAKKATPAKPKATRKGKKKN